MNLLLLLFVVIMAFGFLIMACESVFLFGVICESHHDMRVQSIFEKRRGKKKGLCFVVQGLAFKVTEQIVLTQSDFQANICIDYGVYGTNYWVLINGFGLVGGELVGTKGIKKIGRLIEQRTQKS